MKKQTLIIAGLLVGASIYFYLKNKKANSTTNTTINSNSSNPTINSNNLSDADASAKALEVINSIPSSEWYGTRKMDTYNIYKNVFSQYNKNDVDKIAKILVYSFNEAKPISFEDQIFIDDIKLKEKIDYATQQIAKARPLKMGAISINKSGKSVILDI